MDKQPDTKPSDTKQSEVKEPTIVEKVVDVVKDIVHAVVPEKRPSDFAVTGRPGHRFYIYSDTPNLSTNGVVFVNGRAQVTQEWGASYIRGQLDNLAQSGDDVVVVIDSDTQRIGTLQV